MSEEKKKLKVNDNCIGCGACIAICEDVFDFDDKSGKAFIKEGINILKHDCLDDAIMACPVDAINYEN